MDIRDHVTTLELTSAPAESSDPVVDTTTTKISEGLQLLVASEGVYDRSIESTVISNLADRNAALLYTRYTSGVPVNPNAVIITPDVSNYILHTNFIRILLKTFVKVDTVMPVIREDGLREGLMRVLDNHRKDKLSFGENFVSAEDINGMIDAYVRHNFVVHSGVGYRVEHILVLPVLNTEINHTLDTFDAFSDELQSTIRAALATLTFKTYLRIILLDGTEFVLWHDSNDLIIMGKL